MSRHTGLAVTDGILLAACLLSGAFHEYISCMLSVVLCVCLLIRIRKQRAIRIKKNVLSVAVFAICAGYGFSCFWAIDSGMAWIGFCKFFPLTLYMVTLWQSSDHSQLRRVLPYFGAATAILSVIGMHLPVLENYFSVSERLAGFFQYPNTYALFLLICELLFFTQAHAKKWCYCIPAVLIAALLYTGSRTVFVLFIISNLALIVIKNKKAIRPILFLLAGGFLFAVAIMLWGKDTVFYRYLNISLTESTFVGRILYAVDALPLLLKYPFGMGYLGYYYVQSSIQTGMYSVMFVHNDLLQLFLDVGLLPGALLLVAVGSYLLNRQVRPIDKLIVGTICIHCILDFNLQFIFVFLLLIHLMDESYNADASIPCGPIKIGATAMVIISLYMAVPLVLAHVELRQAADVLYPFNTQNQLALLKQEKDIQNANQISQDILTRNKACYVPYSVQAQYAYAQGDFANVIHNKRLALEKAYFCYEEYEQYCIMLINGIQAYIQIGDIESAKICKQELCDVTNLLSSVKNKMSPLGKMINDQPKFELSEDIQSYIEQILSAENKS